MILLIIILIATIVYGKRLIKIEKIDAVFGNPERSKGGYHWIIAGSCSILLLWFYFSWDVARSFFPNSANELCQVAKVRDSLVSIKYVFPIEQKTLKSSDFIKRENRNIELLNNQIKQSSIANKDKDKLIFLLVETQSLIKILSDEKYLNPEIKNKVLGVANQIDSLSKNIQNKNYPQFDSLSSEEKIAIKKQGFWGETGAEVPFYPNTKFGLKFDAASKELNKIVEQFFLIKNNSEVFEKKSKELDSVIENYRDTLAESQEVETQFAREVSKIYGRVTRSNIFPANVLDPVEQSVVRFEEVQKKEQGSLKIIDTLLFPGGTVVASGQTCSEQGSGRWLPKPTDTLKEFLHLLDPNQGYKNVPLFWYEMMGINKVVDFILPDWIADLVPGKYPVHNNEGKVISNFKSNVLDIVTGNFELFSIPVPSGHIWDSFLRVFLGLTLGILCGVPLGLFMGLSRFAAGYFDPLIELYRPVPPLAWAPLIITVFGIDNSGKIFLLFIVSFAIMVISARAGASGTQLSKIHAAHSLGASHWQILKEVIFPNSLPEILTGIRVAIGVCWGTLVAAEFLAGTTGIGFVENVARKYMQYEVIWITIFVMGLLGLLFDIGMRKIINKTIPWRGKG
ncbi:MAG: ABC transporter permease subunit [Proteobacteria bacterium]|nr:ABC transporter permease subunit [Pseudomonadota bacterium]